MRDPVPSPISHLYGTSNTNDLHPIRCRTQRFQNSFFPDALKCWNNTGPDIRSLDSLSCFKSTLTQIINPSPSPIWTLRIPVEKYKDTWTHTRTDRLTHNIYTTIFKSSCISPFQLKSENVLAKLYIVSSQYSNKSMSNKFL